MTAGSVVQTASPVAPSMAASDVAAPPARSIRRRAAQFWIQLLVGASQKHPDLMRHLRGPGLWFAWRFSSHLRDATQVNAARILGADSSQTERRELARAMVGSYFDFLFELGSGRGHSADELAAKVERVEGIAAYQEARARGKGAIIVTAHIGSFEVGAAMMRRHEKRVHVVFQRDPMPVFESLRADQHRRAGLIEAPVNPVSGDDGWTIWLSIRDALMADEVVLMQGDRVMPGQRGRRMPFLGGHMMLPPGPVKLARATGAPIIPVCSPRLPDGRVRIIVEKPIWVDELEHDGTGPHPAERQLANVIEGWVSRYPEQWLMVDRAWCEDGAGGVAPQ